MKQLAEYNKMAKELEHWTTAEQEDGKPIDTEKKPGDDWMELLSNLAKELTKEVAGGAEGKMGMNMAAKC